MKKWTAVLLTGAMFAATCLGGTITAFAGVTTNKPAGEGIVSGNDLSPSFVAANCNSENPPYAIEPNDSGVQYKNVDQWTEMVVNAPIDKSILSKDDFNISLTYTFVSMPDTADSGDLLILPGTYDFEKRKTYAYCLTGSNAGITTEYQTRQSGDPAPTLITHHNQDTVLPLNVDQPWQQYSWNPSQLRGLIAAHGTGCFRIQLKRNETNTNWFDVTLERGPIQNGAYVRVPGVTVTNWAPIDTENDFYIGVWEKGLVGAILDGVKLEVSYTDGTEKTDTIFESNFDDRDIVAGFRKGDGATSPVENKFLARGNGKSNAECVAITSQLAVTNPSKDFRFVTTTALVAGEGLDVAFEASANLRIKSIEEGVKVGIAFGLKDATALPSAPDEGASFVYFKTTGSDVYLGVENVNAEGNVTAVGTEHKIDGATVGAYSDYLRLAILGKSDGSITVRVNDNEVGSFAGLKVNGHIAFTQTEGNVSYAIDSNSVTINGYELSLNESDEAVTANFNGDYIDYGKFDVQSNLATAGQIEKREGAHDITGITPENGKVGFYGTGTNTRLMFKKQYSDFVLQFDYISEPYKQRGKSLVDYNLYNPLMMTFGVKGEGSIQPLDAGYGIAIIDGNPGQDMWGGESIVMCHGATKCAREGLSGDAYTKVLSTLKVAEGGESDTTILASGGAALDGQWCEPNFDPATGYSFYNRTTRIKLVVLSNKFTVYIAPVETDGTVGDYREVLTGVVSDSKGYVGFATDAPAWCVIDNVALTPISKEVVVEKGYNPTYDQNIVADVDPANMATDVAPAPLDKPQLTVDGTKVKWQAYDSNIVECYHVVVTLDGETKIDRLYVNPEVDLSSLTTPGDYTVKVTVQPYDDQREFHFESSATITYTVAEPAPEEPENKGCGSAIGGWAAGGILLTAAAAVLITLPRKRKDK